MPSDTTTEAPKVVDLFAGTGITRAEDQPVGQLEDLDDDALGDPDAISHAVVRAGYLSPYTHAGCLLPSERDERGEEEGQFSRYYFPVDGQEAVLVDEPPGGSKVEIAQQEADAQVALKREWARSRGIEYIVFVDPLLSEFS